jgi:predicted Zn-dependent peptidase
VNETVFTHRLPNGLVLIAEPMEWLESAAFSLLLPSGCVHDPPDRLGLAQFTCEMIQRGSGRRDSRQFVEDLEALGVDFSASPLVAHTSFGASMLSENLHEALGIAADLVRRPHFPEEQIDDARQVCFQELRSVEDDLAQRLFTDLRRRQYGDPWGRSTEGTWESVEAITHDDVRRFWERNYIPQGTILSVAGKLDWDSLRERVEELFGDWPAGGDRLLVETPATGGVHHIPHESNQVHIGVAYPSVPYGHADYYQAWGAMSVLGSGMSSRLFVEIRENRGLCYTVSASYNSLRDRASIRCYVGTRAERAQESLDVLLSELNRFAQGVLPDELARLKARIKTGLILQQESSRARSSSNAGDWYSLGRVPSLDEVAAIVDALSVDTINSYLAKNPPGDFTIVILGPQALEVRLGVS